jgi:membrane protease YdiL (CAAX protease family)
MATTKQIYTYMASLLIVSWTVQLPAILFTEGVYSEDARIWLALTMVSPAIVTFFFLKKNKDLRGQLLWKPNSQTFLASFIAVLIPILIAFSVLVAVQTFGYGQSEWFSFSDSGVNIKGGPFFLGKGDQSWLVFFFNVFITGAAFALLNACIASGEEVTWRGLVQPLLVAKLGFLKGICLLGFIWSMFHLPILVNGYNYPENPILGSFILFPIRLIAASYFYAWLTLKSKSFIPAAIAHGAGNGIQQAIVSNIDMNTSQIYESVLTLIVTVVIGLFFLVLTYRKEKK